MPSACASCRGPLHDGDRHVLCTRCLGLDHAEAALIQGGCPECDSLGLAELRTRFAVFTASEPAAPVLPPLFEPRKKKRRSQRLPEHPDGDVTPAQSPRASPLPDVSPQPVHFTRADLHPSNEAVGLVSFGASGDDDRKDDSLSLDAASDDWPGSFDPAPSTTADTSAGTSMDSEIVRILSKAVEDLGLDWSSPEEPARSRLDEWFLQGRRQAPPTETLSFLP